MMSFFSQLGIYWNFAWGLRGFLKEPIDVERSWQLTKHRLENREQNLINIVKKSIYANEASPYLKLLKLAGCEYGDFNKMVLSDGIEPTLRKLSAAGVYLTIEENLAIALSRGQARELRIAINRERKRSLHEALALLKLGLEDRLNAPVGHALRWTKASSIFNYGYY